MDSLLPKRPENLRAEQALLGTILANSRRVLPALEMLRAEHFADPLHGRLFAECVRREAVGIKVDGVTLKHWFESDPAATEAGPGYLATLIGSFVGFGTELGYAEAIIDLWRRRRAIEVAEDLLVSARDGTAEIEQSVSATVAGLDEITGHAAQRQGVLLDQAVADAVVAGERVRAGGGVSGLTTGFAALDDVLGGFEPGALYVLAGRPGMGKTALGLQMALAAVKAGTGVAYISLEMQAAQLGRRALAIEADLPGAVIRKGAWNNSDADRMVRAQHRLQGLPLTIEDEAALTTQAIAARARAIRRKHKLGLLVVDHLHIVGEAPEMAKRGETAAVKQVSNALKRLAKDMAIPILALAQLNRGVEGRDDKRPTLSDLRQSGEIEQDAESVMLLYRPEYYLAHSAPERKEGKSLDQHAKAIAEWQDAKERLRGKAELILPKVRDGETCTIPLRFDGRLTAFFEVSQS